MKIENINILGEIFRNAQMKGRNGKVDFFVSRLQIASRETSMVALVNRLMTSLDCDKQKIYGATMKAFLDCKDRDSDLLTIRNYADLVGMICSYKQEEREEYASQIPHIDTDTCGVCAPRGNFDIPLRLTLKSQMAHGADSSQGNTIMFNREDAITTSNGKLFLPHYSANALRGILRRKMAVHLTERLGLKWNPVKPVYSLWFFYCLTCGGSIGEKDKSDSEAEKLIGKGGVLNLQEVFRLRELLPGWSVFGGNFGQKSFEGRVIVNELRPECYEWGTGTTHASSLLSMVQTVRHDDFENPEAYTGMIMNCEMMNAGTVMEGGIDFKPICSSIEKAAFLTSLKLLMDYGYLGAKNSEGYGQVEWEPIDEKHNLKENVEMYENYIAEKKDEILNFLKGIGALEGVE